MPAPRFGETDEEVQNEAQKSILRVFHALILSDFLVRQPCDWGQGCASGLGRGQGPRRDHELKEVLFISHSGIRRYRPCPASGRFFMTAGGGVPDSADSFPASEGGGLFAKSGTPGVF
ncbi:MAG TPA: hypothetical protein DCM58_03040 [Desulfovibrio sp.]|nr:hypothetical protein [Desulfovibrio sp.]